MNLGVKVLNPVGQCVKVRHLFIDPFNSKQLSLSVDECCVAAYLEKPTGEIMDLDRCVSMNAFDTLCVSIKDGQSFLD